MSQRSARERFAQAVLYEVIALVLLTPVYSFALDLPMDNSFATMLMISVAVVIWVWIYNTIFDRVISMIFAIYTYVFYLIYDRLRPVRA